MAETAAPRTIEQRLDGQKNAIKDLRRRVERLEQLVEQLVGTPAPAVSGNPDEWAIPPHCAGCGHPKETGRELMLTCKQCASVYNAQIKGKHEGPPVKYAECGYCGAGKKPSFLPVCGTCQIKARDWKAAQA